MFIPPFRFRPQFAATYTSIYFTGVFAGNGTLVGVVASPIRWILLIIGGVPEEQLANAIFSISTPLSTFTAEVVDGEAVEVHDLHHTNYEKEMSLSSESDDVQYTLRLYPSHEFYHKRHTLLPLIITIVTGLVIFLLLSLVLLNASYLTMQLERDTTQKLVDSKANFIRVISHELRTPLQSLRLGLELLLAEVTATSSDMRVPDVNSLTEIQEDLAANVDMAVKTLDDLLEYDKLRSGETALNEEVTLLPILLEVLAPFKRLAERRQIKVTLLFDTHSASSDKVFRLHPVQRTSGFAPTASACAEYFITLWPIRSSVSQMAQ
jgi:signal transduction histidine kinase